MSAASSLRPRLQACLLLLFVPLLSSGCGPDKPPTYPVSGTVTWDGAPLPEGDILFVPEDDTLVPDHGKIREGKFSFPAKAGKKRVEIRAMRKGKFDPVMQDYMREPYIPEEYNSRTVLTAEVKADGDNHFRFDLVLKR